MLVKAAIGFVLVYDKHFLAGWVLANENVHMVPVRAFSAFDIAVMVLHIDRPFFALGISATALRAGWVLDGNI